MARKPGAKAPQLPADSNVPTDPAERAKYDKLGPLLSRIGEEAALIAGGKSDGLFLYAEFKGKQARVFVFRDRGKTVKLFAETPQLRALVVEAWALQPPGKRWAIMAYEGLHRTFDARMLYSEEVDFKQPFEKRLRALMPKRFDGKKIVVERKPPSDEKPGGEEQEDADPIADKRWT